MGRKVVLGITVRDSTIHKVNLFCWTVVAAKNRALREAMGDEGEGNRECTRFKARVRVVHPQFPTNAPGIKCSYTPCQ